ncbi:MerR family transcriptional regulator [Streptomyces sp. NPDC056632]|uniref:MerR family transcriptional regulator n=1 Tax=Streptomyces sp. NPDC056632 TaxID=3345884 RepID=UPI0036A7C89F
MDTLLPIGELALRTGLSVKTIRAWSESGLVAPAARTGAGYRLYDADAAARLDLVRTLRELGLDLATIRKVLDRESTLAEVAAAHAEALEVSIRLQRRRHAVLTEVVRRGCDAEQTALLHRLAGLTGAERTRLVEDFLDSALGDAPELAGVVRSMTPEPPADPTRDQLLAWLEWAELAGDPDFRALLRRLAEEYVAEREPAGPPRPHLVARIRGLVTPALAAGVPPRSPEAAPVVRDLLALYGGAERRAELLARLKTLNDPRRQRHLELLARINGWPAPEPLAPVLDWVVGALS